MFSNETCSFFNNNSNILVIKCERQVPKIVGKLIEILRRRVEGLTRNCFNSLWISGYFRKLETSFRNFYAVFVTAALRVTLRDMTETYVAVAWDRAVPDDHAS